MLKILKKAIKKYNLKFKAEQRVRIENIVALKHVDSEKELEELGENKIISINYI